MTTFRFIARSLLRRTTFTLVSITLLALGIASVTAVFSLVDIALLRPLPFADPDRLEAIRAVEPAKGDSSTESSVGPEQFFRSRSESRLFHGIEGATPKRIAMVGSGDPEALRGMQVSAGMFSLLGASPRLGRSFTREEEITASPVTILSDEFWRDRFHADRSVLGRSIVLDGVARRIVGVAPPGFSIFLDERDVYLPLPLDPLARTSRVRAVFTIGRLARGVGPQQATAELNRIFDEVGKEIPAFRRTRPRVVSLREEFFGRDRGQLLVLIAAVAVLLTIACVNVLNLAFSDSLARRPTTMIRLALGASPLQIVVLRIAEGMAMTATAGIAGVVMSRLSLAALTAVDPQYFAGFGDLSLNARTLGVSALVGVVAGTVSFVPVAISESRIRVATLASTAAHAVGNRRDQRVREILLAAQVSLALLLLLGSTLLGRNLRASENAVQGFVADGLAAFQLVVPPRYETDEMRGLYVRRIVEAVAQVPGVQGATATQSQFSIGSSSTSFFAVQGIAMPDSASFLANIRRALPGVFEVMKTRIIEGRGFDGSDRSTTHPVAVVSASFARQVLNGHAIGARIRRTAKSTYQWMDVVGVVEDVKDAGLGVDLGPTVWADYEQESQSVVGLTILVRLRDVRLHVERAVQRAIWSVDPGQPLFRVATVDALERESAAAPRFQAAVVTLFGTGALILVLGGIYATTLFSVLKRTREIGVRAALGAGPSRLVAESAWRSVRPVGVGIAVGLFAAVPAMRLMQRSLNQTLTTDDAPMLIVVVAALAIASVIASVIPARRAATVSPLSAMRSL